MQYHWLQAPWVPLIWARHHLPEARVSFRGASWSRWHCKRVKRSNELPIPTDVRIMRASHQFAAGELETLLRPALLAKLPVGVELMRLELPKSYLSVPNVQAGDIQLPRLAKRTGITRVTVVFELMSGSALMARLPVSVELSLDERATHFAIERGSVLNVFVETGAARVSASAVVMNPADVGDVVPCQIIKTRKILRAKVLTTHEALVVQ